MVDNKAYLVEFIGTTILCFHMFCSGAGNSQGLICGYMALMLITARVSGGHFNPGITMGMLVNGKASNKTFLIYLLMHCAGSFAAAALFLMINGGYNKFGKQFDADQMWQMFLLYLGAQTAITMIYLLIATHPKSPRAAFSFCVPMTQMFVNSFSRFADYPFLGNCAVMVGGAVFRQGYGALAAGLLGCLGGGALGGWLYKTVLAE